MSGEMIYVYGSTPIILENQGQATPSGTVMQAMLSDYNVMNAGAGYPDGQFALTCSFATAPVEGGVINLYARPENIDGSLNAQAPEATRPTLFIGSFNVDNVAGSQSMVLMAYDLPQQASYYLYNNSTGQAISSGWTLKLTPRTYKGAP